MLRLENDLKVAVLTQSANIFFLTPLKLPDPQFQPLKVTTSIPVRLSMGVPPPRGILYPCILNEICTNTSEYHGSGT